MTSWKKHFKPLPRANRPMPPIVLPYRQAFAELQKRKKTVDRFYKHTMTKVNNGQWQVKSELDLEGFYAPSSGVGVKTGNITSIRPSGPAISVIEDTTSGVLPFFKEWQSIVRNSTYGKLGK